MTTGKEKHRDRWIFHCLEKKPSFMKKSIRSDEKLDSSIRSSFSSMNNYSSSPQKSGKEETKDDLVDDFEKISSESS
jgi:hypothetical protein